MARRRVKSTRKSTISGRAFEKRARNHNLYGHYYRTIENTVVNIGYYGCSSDHHCITANDVQLRIIIKTNSLLCLNKSACQNRKSLQIRHPQSKPLQNFYHANLSLQLFFRLPSTAYRCWQELNLDPAIPIFILRL